MAWIAQRWCGVWWLWRRPAGSAWSRSSWWPVRGLGRRPRGRFLVTDEIRQRLAFWRGNAAAVHRELVEAARNGGPVAPSLSTLQRAVARDVLAGDRAGLAGGERAGRAFDVFGAAAHHPATRCGRPIMSRPRWRSTSRAGC